MISISTDKMMTVRNKPTSVYQALLKPGRRPRGGWSSAITLNGSKIPIRGTDSVSVALRAQELLNHNRVQYTINQIWATLNLDWLSRTKESDRLVDLDQFLGLIKIPEGELAFTGKVPSAVWGPSQLDAMGFYLSIDPESYEYETLLAMATAFIHLTDPVRAYRLGEHGLHATFLERYRTLRYKPCHLLENAREWLKQTYQVMAPVAGMLPLDPNDISNKYHWINE